MKKVVILIFIFLSVLSGYSQSCDFTETSFLPDEIDTSVVSPDSSRPYALIAGGSKGIGYALAEC